MDDRVMSKLNRDPVEFQQDDPRTGKLLRLADRDLAERRLPALREDPRLERGAGREGMKRDETVARQTIRAPDFLLDDQTSQ